MTILWPLEKNVASWLKSIHALFSPFFICSKNGLLFYHLRYCIALCRTHLAKIHA